MVANVFQNDSDELSVLDVFWQAERIRRLFTRPCVCVIDFLGYALDDSFDVSDTGYDMLNIYVSLFVVLVVNC